MLIEEYTIAWLHDLGYEASLRVPGHESAPDEYVTAYRSGGASEVGIARPMMLIKCWADSELRAAEMAEDIEARIRAGEYLSHDLGIYKATPAGTSPALDPDGRKLCRLLIVNVVMAAA